MTDAITPRVRQVENMVARARSISAEKDASGCLLCETSVWLSFFFDGTNNNLGRDDKAADPRGRPSNIVALYRAHREDRDLGIYRFYYEGVGTRFQFDGRIVPGWFGSEKAGYEESESTYHQGVGAAMDIRLEKAAFELKLYLDIWCRFRKIKEANIAIFGFSRGAATARSFVHWVAKIDGMSIAGASLKYHFPGDGTDLSPAQDVVVNIKFLGIYDTVLTVHDLLGGTDSNLVPQAVPDYVQQTVHLMAAQEFRVKSFPVTLLNSGGGKRVALVFPGMHSDVGGGYMKGEQGRKNELARVYAQIMLDYATAAGLKMYSLSDLHANPELDRDIYARYFKYTTDLDKYLEIYRGELGKYGPKAGAPATVFRTHAQPYWAWMGSGRALDDTKKKLASGDPDLAAPETQAELKRLQFIQRNAAQPDAPKAADGAIQRWEVSDNSALLFSTYIHDSMAGFSMTGGVLEADFSTVNYGRVRGTVDP